MSQRWSGAGRRGAPAQHRPSTTYGFVASAHFILTTHPPQRLALPLLWMLGSGAAPQGAALRRAWRSRRNPAARCMPPAALRWRVGAACGSGVYLSASHRGCRNRAMASRGRCRRQQPRQRRRRWHASACMRLHMPTSPPLAQVCLRHCFHPQDQHLVHGCCMHQRTSPRGGGGPLARLTGGAHPPRGAQLQRPARPAKLCPQHRTSIEQARPIDGRSRGVCSHQLPSQHVVPAGACWGAGRRAVLPKLNVTAL